MAEEQDVNALKRRGRRRLVGSVALVLLAVIVLPMVFDPEPRQSPPPVSVRIPSQDDGGFSPKVTPKSPPAAAAAPAAKVPEPPKAAKPAPPKEAAGEETKRAEAALANAEFVVPVVALANLDKVKELTAQLAAAKLPYYTEPIATAKGNVTRVRVGPFESREAAEKALQKLKELGLKPGNVTTKS